MTRHPLDDQARNPGDAWVEGPDGARYWGRFGAAGLLAIDAERGVLMQHRVGWSHFGGTWALPGGALHEAESVIDGAIREAQEEAGVPDGVVVPRFTHVFDADVWTYTTVVADVALPFEPRITDPESLALAWVPVDEVDQLPLHPGFAASWPVIREQLAVRPALLVDAANVVGSVPNGWWKDRAGAASGLRTRLEALFFDGVPAPALGRELGQWFPAIVMVTEGQANAIEDADGFVAVRRALGPGDDEIVRGAEALASDGFAVTAVTSDRELSERLIAVGAEVRGAGWLNDLLAATPSLTGHMADVAEGDAAGWAATGLTGAFGALFRGFWN